LYDLAGDNATVMSCLAQALGSTISLPSPDEKARSVEKTAGDILRNYERTNRAAGKDRDAVVKLLKVREAMDAKNAGRPEVAIDVSACLELTSNFEVNTFFRSWIRLISSRWMGMLPELLARLRNSRIFTNHCREICRHT